MARLIWGKVVASIMGNSNLANKLSDNLIDYETVCTESIEETKNFKKPRPFLILFTTLLGIIVVISVILNFTFLLQHSRCKTMDTSDQKCFDCRYFNGSGLSLLSRTTNGTGLSQSNDDSCCIENSDFYQMLMQYLSSLSRNRTGNDRPIAHLTLNATATKSLPSKLHWNTISNTSDVTRPEVLEHVVYVDDMLEITDPGTYFVYSFITFRVNETQNDPFLNHYIYREDADQQFNRAQMVFMDKQTRLNGEVKFQTSFLAGIMNFHSHDRMYTAVSDVSAVYGSPLSNFIGLFML